MTTTTNVEIKRLNQVEVTLRMVGTTPLYFNSMSAKTKRDLLIGGGKKTAAEKKQIKHNPEQEFKDSLYKKSYGETLLCFPAPGIKQAMATAALETDGIKKTTVNRLLFLPEQYVNVWGTPYLKMDIVRSADINKTPDVRTRGYLPRWCAEVRLRFIAPALSTFDVTSLLSNAGTIVGIGDFRQEKGRGSFGCFDVFDGKNKNIPEWKDIVKESREAQQHAVDYPICADPETEELMEMMGIERQKRAA
jgi:hypothetical protein|tara:strand:+ start:255 stop:998 length:744 start_codon:yes stop_codon:yes gene_type:complete